MTVRKRHDHARGARAKARRERVVDLHDPRTLAAVNRYVLHERPLDAESPFVFLVGDTGARRCEPMCVRSGARRRIWRTARHSPRLNLYEAGTKRGRVRRRRPARRERVLGGNARWARLDDEAFHSVIDAAGEWRIGVQLAPEHVPPDWPDGTPQQVHIDLHVEDPEQAHEQAIQLGARVLQAGDLESDEGHEVYADPAGHPFCIGWGQPSREALAAFVRDRRG